MMKINELKNSIKQLSPLVFFHAADPEFNVCVMRQKRGLINISLSVFAFSGVNPMLCGISSNSNTAATSWYLAANGLSSYSDKTKERPDFQTFFLEPITQILTLVSFSTP